MNIKAKEHYEKTLKKLELKLKDPLPKRTIAMLNKLINRTKNILANK